MTITINSFAGLGTISSAAYSIPNQSTASAMRTDTGIFQFFVGSSAMQSGDRFEVKLIDAISSAAGNQYILYYGILDGVQTQALVTPAVTLGNSWDFQVKQLQGVARVFEWRVSKIS